MIIRAAEQTPGRISVEWGILQAEKSQLHGGLEIMMNYIWAGMLVLGVVFAILNGRLNEFSEGLMKSCTDGVYFIIGLAGIMGVWSGIMNIAKETGLIDLVANATRPVIRFLFPSGLRKDTIAMILMSFTANLFGAGNSATVFSIKALVMLDEENSRREAQAMPCACYCSQHVNDTAGTDYRSQAEKRSGIRQLGQHYYPRYPGGPVVYGSIGHSLQDLRRETSMIASVLNQISLFFIPGIVTLVIFFGIYKKAPVYDLFIEDKGWTENSDGNPSVYPCDFIGIEALVGSGLCSSRKYSGSVFQFFGIPKELLSMVLLRPISGSGSLVLVEKSSNNMGRPAFSEDPLR